MVTLADAIFAIHPDATPLIDYTVGVADGVESIVAWHLANPQPTTEELAAVTQDEVDAARLGKSITAAVGAIQQPDLLDLTTASVNLVLQVIGTRVNDAFRAMGREPPLLQLDVINDVRALIGLPPLEPP